jgi:hypothetical protein
VREKPIICPVWGHLLRFFQYCRKVYAQMKIAATFAIPKNDVFGQLALYND